MKWKHNSKIRKTPFEILSILSVSGKKGSKTAFLWQSVMPQEVIMAGKMKDTQLWLIHQMEKVEKFPRKIDAIHQAPEDDFSLPESK